MGNYIEPDFKLLMLLHEMFTFTDGNKKQEKKKKTQDYETQDTGIDRKNVRT